MSLNSVVIRPIRRDDRIAQNIHIWNDRIAVKKGDRALHYSDLDRRADVLGGVIGGMVDPRRQRVGIFFSRNRVSYFEITLAARRAGVSYTTFKYDLSGKKVVEEMMAHPCVVLFVDGESYKKIEPFQESLITSGRIIINVSKKEKEKRWPETVSYAEILSRFERPGATADPSFPRYQGPVIYSSGTTSGGGKLVESGGSSQAGDDGRELFPFGFNDRHLVVGDLYHAAPASWSKGHLNRGAEVVLGDFPTISFRPKRIARLIENEKITNFYIASPWLHSLCIFLSQSGRQYDLSSLKNIFVNAAPFPPPLKKMAVGIFGPILWEYYGTTEFGLITILPSHELLDHAATVGKSAPGVAIEIRSPLGNVLGPSEPGIIWIKNERTKGEYRASEDWGMLDQNGYLTILGRSQERIVSRKGTEIATIFPREIENELFAIPEIRDCYVLAVPDPDSEESVVAAVVLHEGRKLKEEKIRSYLKKRLNDDRKVPMHIFFFSSLPRSPSKVNIRRLTEMVLAKMGYIEKNPE
jgi:long-chain acyl-CoA synthetase